MERIGWLFEHPLWLYVVCGVAEAVIGFGWLLSRSRRWKRAAIVPAGIALLVAVLGIVVQTDREKISAALKDIAARVETGDFAGVGRHLDPACRCPTGGGGSLSKQELLDRGKSVATRFSVWMVHARRIRTVFDGDAAATELDVLTTSDAGLRLMSWRVRWARRGDGWRIVEVELLSPKELRDLLS